MRRQSGGLRRGDEVDEHLDEALGGLAVRVVSHAFEDLETAAGDDLVRRDGVLVPAGWDEAFAAIEAKLAPIRESGDRNESSV